MQYVRRKLLQWNVNELGCETCEDLQTDFWFSCWNVWFSVYWFCCRSKSRSAVLYVMVRTLWPACNKYKVAVIATVTELPLLFKVHKIWSVDSKENHSNCWHQMSDFMAKKHQIWFRLALPQTPVAGFKGPTSKGRKGGKRKEGREGTGKEGKGGQKSNPPCWNFTNTALHDIWQKSEKVVLALSKI